MEEKSITISIGSGFGCLLQIAFIVLKLCKVITWRWVWVLSPLWIGAILNIIVLVIFIIIDAVMNR